MQREGLEKVAGELRGEIRWDEPMASHTALRVGGPADLFIEPADLADMKDALANLAAGDIPYFVVGGGYNLLVRDGGIRGCVISLRGLDSLKPMPGARLEVSAGVINGMLCRIAAENCLAGIEFLCGIPGTFGGAVAMNAGAHGDETLRRVESLTTLRHGEIVVQKGGDLSFGYRYLKLHPGEIVVSARLRLEPAERRVIEERMSSYLSIRGNSQRVTFPSAGSFFKNPPGGQAWRLIDQAGLRGVSVGGAQVSEVHTNFLVNRGGARATDFLALAALVKVRVQEKSGVELEEEVQIIGEG
ncbi:MAG: UDP-N-acetylenolpyruvoylglucosamine reductase [Geobacteraceae bacterium GWC2_58_44]|nr:MAG: UDP-N-acetylenolpyruvoylglucosamine reductase [Geobacteraceae bacterium GWC2_58_44]